MIPIPISKYPSLDVHGETRDTVIAVLNSFIRDNIKLRNSTILIIHGKGTGILKKEVHLYLKNNKYVKTYHLHHWNQGLTVVELKIS